MRGPREHWRLPPVPVAGLVPQRQILAPERLRPRGQTRRPVPAQWRPYRQEQARQVEVASARRTRRAAEQWK